MNQFVFFRFDLLFPFANLGTRQWRPSHTAGWLVSVAQSLPPLYLEVHPVDLRLCVSTPIVHRDPVAYERRSDWIGVSEMGHGPIRTLEWYRFRAEREWGSAQ